MTRRTLLGVAAMGLALAAAPVTAEAAHRHSRSCGHRYSDSRYRYDGYRSYRSYRYAPRPPAYVYGYDPYSYNYGYYGSPYYGPYYDPYAYGYSRPYRYSRYGYSRPYYGGGYHYHGRNRCSRPHFSIHIGF